MPRVKDCSRAESIRLNEQGIRMDGVPGCVGPGTLQGKITNKGCGRVVKNVGDWCLRCQAAREHPWKQPERDKRSNSIENLARAAAKKYGWKQE